MSQPKKLEFIKFPLVTKSEVAVLTVVAGIVRVGVGLPEGGLVGVVLPEGRLVVLAVEGRWVVGSSRGGVVGLVVVALALLVVVWHLQLLGARLQVYLWVCKRLINKLASQPKIFV